MKINLLFWLGLTASVSLSASPLATTTTVHAKPDKSAPAVAVLAAGTEPELAPLPAEPVPAGWEAVVVASQQDAYVASKDISKSLDVKIGATLRGGPKADAPVIGTMEAGDYAEIVTVKGRWHQVKLTKKSTGYIYTGKVASGSVATAPTPSPAPAAAAPAPAPATPTASTFAGAGRPVETVSLGENAALPRLFQGTFASSRRPLMPRRPYDFQLNDANGERYAYLDVSKLLLTEQIDKYIDHTVVVYGTAKPVPNTRDIVIEVESLQLR